MVELWFPSVAVEGVLHPPEDCRPCINLGGFGVDGNDARTRPDDCHPGYPTGVAGFAGGLMPKRIPIAEAERVAKAQKCEQVIIMAWDGELSHCVTYGTTRANCEQAALGGKKLMEVLGWNDGRP